MRQKDRHRPTELLFVVLFLVISLRPLRGQAPTSPSPAARDYSQEAFVVEEAKDEFVFENDGTFVRKSFLRVRIQSDAAIQQLAVLSFSYQGFSEVLDIDYVRVRKPDKSVVSTPLTDIQDLATETAQQAPMYSDSRVKQIPVRGMGVGDALEYQVTWHTGKPLVPGQFWLAFNFPRNGILLDEGLRVSVPRERKVKWSSSKSKPSIEETGDRRIFTWTDHRLENISKEQQQKETDLAVYQASRGRLPQPDIQISSFQTWEDIGRWYLGLREERTKPNAEIAAKALDLTKGLNSEEDKVRAIYGFVSTKIHYVGVDFGVGRFQPHGASEVLANQYGDCKDKDALLATLLQAIGIHSSPALIGSLREIDESVPSPAQFDHILSAVQIGDRLLWLDTTPEVNPFGYLFSVLRDKKALLMQSHDAAFVSTPADGPSTPTAAFRIAAELSDTGLLKGKIERSDQGDDAEVAVRLLFRRTARTQWKELAQQISYQSGFSGDVSEVEVSSPEKTDEPFKWSYKYERKDFPDWNDRKLASALPPMPLPAIPETGQAEHPIWLGSPAKASVESLVKLPAGYHPSVPKDLDLSEAFAEYHRSYQFKDGVLITQRTLTTKAHEIAPANLPAYKKFHEAVDADYDSKITLLSALTNPSDYQSEIWNLPLSENAAANKAYNDGVQQSARGDVAGTRASVKRALELDPKWVRAWLWLGEIDKSMHRKDDALIDYREALKIDAHQPVSLKALGFSLMNFGKYEEAIPIFRQLVEVSPGDIAGYEGLGRTLLTLSRYSEAIVPLEAALRINPESANDLMGLRLAYLSLGNTEKAVESF